MPVLMRTISPADPYPDSDVDDGLFVRVQGTGTSDREVEIRVNPDTEADRSSEVHTGASGRPRAEGFFPENPSQQKGQVGSHVGAGGAQVQKQAGRITPGASHIAQQHQGQLGSQFGYHGQQQPSHFAPLGSPIGNFPQQQGQLGAQLGGGGSVLGAQAQQ